MRRICRTIFGVLASASLPGGGGAAFVIVPAAAPAGVVAMVPHPTAVEC